MPDFVVEPIPPTATREETYDYLVANAGNMAGQMAAAYHKAGRHRRPAGTEQEVVIDSLTEIYMEPPEGTSATPEVMVERLATLTAVLSYALYLKENP